MKNMGKEINQIIIKMHACFSQIIFKGLKWISTSKTQHVGIGRNFKGEHSFQSICLHTVSSPCI